MEWKNVRKWLLLMLLAVDLFLAGNLVRQLYDNRQAERQAVLDAVTVAAGQGIHLTGEEVLSLPMEFDSYSAARSDSLEQAAANALLGKGSLQEGPGGGVNIYRGESGQLSFRRGGALELDLPWSGQILDGAACAELLAPAGLNMENALVENGDGGVTLTQRYQETVIVNSRLTCTVQEGTLQVRGRWLLAQELTAGSSSLSRAQLVLSLCELLESREAGSPDRLEAGYYLQSQDAQTLTLVPVWVVALGEEQLLLSCITGQELTF